LIYVDLTIVHTGFHQNDLSPLQILTSEIFANRQI